MTNEVCPSLFEEEPDLSRQSTPPLKPIAASVARVLMPHRAQVALRASDLESLLPEGHRARIVWAYVEQADLSRVYAGIKAMQGGSGRTPIAPEILPARQGTRIVFTLLLQGFHLRLGFFQAERQGRVEHALQRLPELEKLKTKQGKKPEEARASTTDAEATVMKRGDGGFRPAYNAQYATDTETQVVVGVAVTTVGSDMAQRVPMLDQVSERCGENPQQWLVEGGYPAPEQLDTVAEETVVDAPVPKPKADTTAPHASTPSDSKAVAAWRRRMGTDQAKAIYKDRAATAKCVNALARERGLTRLWVRGKAKVRGVLLLHALAHNLMRTFAWVPEGLGFGVVAANVAAA